MEVLKPEPFNRRFGLKTSQHPDDQSSADDIFAKPGSSRFRALFFLLNLRYLKMRAVFLVLLFIRLRFYRSSC